MDDFAPLSLKFVRKYMRLAKLVGQDENPCYSRQIGTVLVDPVVNRVLGMGYNGPPKSTPHTDSREYLENFVWPQLTEQERECVRVALAAKQYLPPLSDADTKEDFCDEYTGCKTCPRRLVGAGSGQRTELCSCAHSERNAIYNASCDVQGAWAFCWCGVPCQDCAGAMINAGIKRVFCYEWGADYSMGSRFLFEKAKVQLSIYSQEFYMASV